MAITQAPPVHAQPHVELRDWIIVQRYSGYHLLGYRVDEDTVRRTTPLVVFDAEQQTCRTQSGRFYQLVSPPVTGSAVQTLLRFAELSLLMVQSCTR